MNSGLIIVNKDKDYTSRDVVNIVGKVLNTKKIGHTGTLDPLATGVLVLGFNDATKIFDLLFSDDKEYIAEVKIGISTDTLDITGNIISSSNDYSIDRKQLITALNHFKGTYFQQVPMYSAVKVNGKKLYEYARRNQEVIPPSKKVTIKEIELLYFTNEKFVFRCVVSKGTYIRSLIRDIGKCLNIDMTMSNLIRTRQGVFIIKQAYNIDDIKNGNYEVISIKEALSNYKQIEVDDKLFFKIINGQKLKNIYSDDVVVFTKSDEVVAIYRKDGNCYRAYKVFNVSNRNKF